MSHSSQPPKRHRNKKVSAKKSHSPWQSKKSPNKAATSAAPEQARTPKVQWCIDKATNTAPLTLHRYPAHSQHVSLQAWDAADEYLINHILQGLTEQTLPVKAHILIMNDDFGALACALLALNNCGISQYQLTWQSDSYIAKQGCLQNLTLNQFDTASVQFIDSLAQVPNDIDLALIKLPRAHALLEHQLIALQGHKAQVIAAGKVKAVQSSVLQLFEKYLGTTTTSLAVKKARLIFSEAGQQAAKASPYPSVWQTESPALTIHNHANVFSRGQLDIGARLLLDHLPDCTGKTVIDLGCGNGILGLSLLAHYAPEKLIFVDESVMAIASAQQNVECNLPAQAAKCEFVLSDCLAAIPQQKAHIVVCNPPFHQQNTLTDHIAWQMFQQARQALYPGGELRVVANRHLQHHDKLKRLFGGYQVVASNQKFSILSAIAR